MVVAVHGGVTIAVVWFDAYRRLWAVTNGRRLVSPRLKPGLARTSTTLRVVPVGSQAFCSRMVRWTLVVVHVYWASANCNCFCIIVATNGSGFSPIARLARIANPGSGAPRLKPGLARTSTTLRVVPVGSQAFCSRMVDYIAGLLSTIIRRTQWQLHSCKS